MVYNALDSIWRCADPKTWRRRQEDVGGMAAWKREVRTYAEGAWHRAKREEGDVEGIEMEEDQLRK